MPVVTNLAIPGLSPLEIAVILAIPFILRVVFAFCKFCYNPLKVPVVGLPPGLFGRLRAVPQVFGHMNQITIEGFSRYCRGENPTVFLAPWNLTDYIYILPPQLVSEHKSIPEHILSFRTALTEEYSTQAMGKLHDPTNPSRTAFLRRKLTGSWGKWLEPVREELKLAFKEQWEQRWVGKEQEGGWIDVPVIPAAMEVVARTSNRAFSGMLLCRDKDFLNNVIDFNHGVAVAGYGVQLCPRELRWLLEPLISFRNRQRIAFSMKKLRPIIEERKAIMECNIMINKEDQINDPEDLLQYLIMEAIKQGPPSSSVEDITSWYLHFNFISLHTTSMTVAYTLDNMATYRDSTGQSYWDLLCEEVLAVDRDSEEGPGIWTKRKVDKLVGMDSFIRESLRLNMAPAVGMVRKVEQKGGYTYSNGLHLKQGAFVGVPSLCINRDQDGIKGIENAEVFDGFRFSRPYQELAKVDIDISAPRGVGNVSATTTSDRYLTFGRGKHECPGRFFAVWLVKMFLMHCVLNYELKPHEPASERYILGNPKSHSDIRVGMRKRKESMQQVSIQDLGSYRHPGI